LLILPEHLIDIALGVFFLVMVPGRRWLASRNLKFGFWHLAVAGAVIGFLTGIVVSTGPLSVPAFAAYGLVKGAFIATEAAGSLALYISKALTFRQFGALPVDIMVKGLISGFVGDGRHLHRTPDRRAAERRRLPAPARRRDDHFRHGALVGGHSLEGCAIVAGIKGDTMNKCLSAAMAQPWRWRPRLPAADGQQLNATNANSQVYIGALTCNVSGGTGYVFGSTPDQGNGIKAFFTAFLNIFRRLGKGR